MNIAVIDDRTTDLHAAENFLKRYLLQNFPDLLPSIRIETFVNAKNFLDGFSSKKYDLLILDIFMKPLNGIQVAQAVRRIDRDAAIIFLTNSEEYILEGYKVFAVGYFLKPLTENVEQFAKTFQYVFTKLIDNRRRINVLTKTGEISVAHKDIRYIEIAEYQRVCIHLNDKKIFPAMSYEKIFDALENDSRFLECYHRILVNMDFIKNMSDEDFILNDGTKIPISRRKSKAVKLKFMSHLLALNSTNTW